MIDEQLPPRLKEAIHEFLQRRDWARPVNLARLTRTARLLVPEFDNDEATLREMIAEELIRRGANIDFDGSGEPAIAADRKRSGERPQRH